LTKLKHINDHYTDTKDFKKYRQDLAQFFELTSQLKSWQMNQNTVDYLAGFIEGEGSLNIGAKKNGSARFKVYIDPEFSVTQHINGIANLFLVLCYFQTGRIRYKTGSHATFVFTIDNRLTLEQKVVPFYEKYLSCGFGTPVKQRRVFIFKDLLRLFKEKAHLDLERMIFEVLPLWHAMRVQIGQTHQSFQSLEDAQDYVRKTQTDHS